MLQVPVRDNVVEVVLLAIVEAHLLGHGIAHQVVVVIDVTQQLGSIVALS